jgi:hypothetical protein
MNVARKVQLSSCVAIIGAGVVLLTAPTTGSACGGPCEQLTTCVVAEDCLDLNEGQKIAACAAANPACRPCSFYICDSDGPNLGCSSNEIAVSCSYSGLITLPPEPCE